LLIRQLRDRGDDLQLVSDDGLSSEDFWLIAGTAGEGTLFTSFSDPSENPGATAIIERPREQDSGDLSSVVRLWRGAGLGGGGGKGRFARCRGGQ
jgi:hypothetical protein